MKPISLLKPGGEAAEAIFKEANQILPHPLTDNHWQVQSAIGSLAVDGKLKRSYLCVKKIYHD